MVEHHPDLAHERIVAHPEAARDREPARDAARDHLVDVLLDEVRFVRFVGVGRERRRFVDQTDRAGERVLEDGRGVGEDVDARAPELVERDQDRALGAAELVLGDPRAEQVQRLRDADAFALEHLAAPEHDADRFGQPAALGDRGFEQLFHGRAPFALGRFARQHAHVGRGHVAAGGQDVPVADDLAAGRRFEVLAVEHGQQPAALRVADAPELRPHAARAVDERFQRFDAVRILLEGLAADRLRLEDPEQGAARGLAGGAQHFVFDQRAGRVADFVEHVVVVGALRVLQVRRAGQLVVVDRVTAGDEPVNVDVGEFEAGVERVEPVLFGEAAPEDVLAGRREVALEGHQLVVHGGDERHFAALRRRPDADPAVLDDVRDLGRDGAALLGVVRPGVVVVVHEAVQVAQVFAAVDRAQRRAQVREDRRVRAAPRDRGFDRVEHVEHVGVRHAVDQELRIVARRPGTIPCPSTTRRGRASRRARARRR